jgi:hydrogenase-4 component B
MIITAYLTAIAMLFFSGLPAWLIGHRSHLGERLSAVLMAGGALLGLAAVSGALRSGSAPEFICAWALPGGHLSLRLDGLAAVFLLPAFLISGVGSLYGLGYFSHHHHPQTAGRLRLWYGILAASITLLPTCRNAVLFLVAWELMALTSFLLILTEQDKEETRRAAFVYLTSTHVATLALYAFFILLDGGQQTFDFPAIGTIEAVSPVATALFLLGLFGFGFKAGIMPLHIWLPGAHAAAPSHVSAVMSGVVIKMGIYGLVRMTSFFHHIPPWWGWTVLVLGVVSGVMGVVFAIAQHDIKRLLAYHSVENIGIILIGLGVALLGRAFEQPTLVVLGLAGALLHVVNHGLFKSLLFLSAGSVIEATGTRQIDSYGGLMKQMPVTGLCFLGGAVAICGLPPLNGFVSEWLIYLGLLHTQGEGLHSAVSMAVVVAPLLALIGALAVACFVKVVGVTFLGEPRRAWPQKICESPRTMTVAMLVLLGCCVLIGVVPLTVVPVLGAALQAWGAVARAADFPGALAPFGWISLVAVLVLILIGGLAFWQWKMVALAGRSATWGCGYQRPTSRMQYTAASFAEMLTGLFSWGLWTDLKGKLAFGFFPEASRFADHTPDVVLDRLLLPACRGFCFLAFKIRSFLQHGIIGVYLLYVALTLVSLLFFVSR